MELRFARPLRDNAKLNKEGTLLKFTRNEALDTNFSVIRRAEAFI